MNEPMIYGEPTEPHLKIMKRPVSIFGIDEVPASSVRLHQDCLQDPMSMRAQAQETVFLSKLVKPRGLDLEADIDLLKAFTDLVIHTTGMTNSPAAYKALARVLDESATIILKEKYKHNYPRPAQVVTKYMGGFKPLIDSDSAKTPSYPSGHSAQAALLALIFSEVFPHRAVAFNAIADTIGMGRVFAGLHTKEDHDYGQNIGAYLFHTMKPEALADLASLMRG